MKKIFALTDAISSKNKKQALQKLVLLTTIGRYSVDLYNHFKSEVK